MRKLLFTLLSLTLAFTLNTASFAQDNNDNLTHKKWTFIIYLNGDNNLDAYAPDNIKAMEKIGSNDDVNIVVQWASLSRRNAVRFLVQKSADPSKVTSPILEDLGLVDMGDYHSLENFIQWAVEHYPADHYFIDVWNHGSGWRKRSFALENKDISWDDISGNVITTEQLGESMRFAANLIGHKVDLYASDACLMGMAEVANQMVDSVSYFAGSQEVEHAEGWPYDALLRRWEANTNATAADVAKILTEEYVASYSTATRNEEVTFSAYDLSQLANLDNAITQLGKSIRQLSPSDRAKLISTAGYAQTFAYHDYADLMDLMTRFSAANIRGLDKKAIAQVRASIKTLVIANAASKSYRANGLSIWLPMSRSLYLKKAARYELLAFNVTTHWNDTLDFISRGLSPEDNEVING